MKGNRESDGFREEKNYKLKETGYVVERPSATKDKHKEEDKSSERITVKKETQSPEQVKSEKLKDLFDYSPLCIRILTQEKSLPSERRAHLGSK